MQRMRVVVRWSRMMRWIPSTFPLYTLSVLPHSSRPYDILYVLVLHDALLTGSKTMDGRARGS